MVSYFSANYRIYFSIISFSLFISLLNLSIYMFNFISTSIFYSSWFFNDLACSYNLIWMSLWVSTVV